MGRPRHANVLDSARSRSLRTPTPWGRNLGGVSGVPGGNNYNVMWREQTIYGADDLDEAIAEAEKLGGIPDRAAARAP